MTGTPIHDALFEEIYPSRERELPWRVRAAAVAAVVGLILAAAITAVAFR